MDSSQPWYGAASWSNIDRRERSIEKWENLNSPMLNQYSYEIFCLVIFVLLGILSIAHLRHSEMLIGRGLGDGNYPTERSSKRLSELVALSESLEIPVSKANGIAVLIDIIEQCGTNTRN
ncbi:hypothetical protein GQ44DRAFT_730425 [Phaeosphaeriaceae sp. PMI808]|nr:hypothetical protein GQ44DRAFT_730425 [Phaeosphaeriaceae sp. PMI808]